METTRLAGAYLRLITAARSLPREDPVLGDRLSVADWILSHIALTDSALAETAAQVRAGERAGLSNHEVVNADTLGSVISARDWSGLQELVMSTASRLIGAVAAVPDARADRPVHVRMVNRLGVEVFVDQIAWRDLIDLRAREQIPGHTAQLLRLRAQVLRG